MRAQGHHYALFVIQLAISHVMVACTSFRGSVKCFELWSEFFTIEPPSLNSIRQWVLRVGLYLLQDHEPRQDWIWVIDLSVELGPAKCLVVLGLPQAQWQQHLQRGGGGLDHHQMRVLAIEVLVKCNGSTIEQKLVSLGERIGEPIQIVCDHGSDLYKGVRLYSEPIDGLIETYDVTHAMALLLKHTLEPQEQFQSFLKQIHQCRQQLQQTALSFLLPPPQRSKARYLNIEPLVEWAQRILDYDHRGDFSEINPHHCCDQEALYVLSLAPQIEVTILQQLVVLKDKTYNNRAEFRQQLFEHLGANPFAKYGCLICQAADLGRRQFESKLGWLRHRQTEVHQYQQLLSLVKCVHKQLKHQGLKQDSQESFTQTTQALSLSEQGQGFREQIVEYLKQQGSSLAPGQTVLSSSDVIESMFGKYKLLSERSPLKELSKLILTIPLCTVKLTIPLVKQALESVRGTDVEHWASEVLGPSRFAQRRAVLNPKKEDTKVA